MSGSDANFFDSKLSKLAEAKERALAQPAGPEQRKIPDGIAQKLERYRIAFSWMEDHDPVLVQAAREKFINEQGD